jgi:hypothetical protein
MIGTLLAYVTGWLASKWLSWLGTVVGWVWWAISTTIKGTLSFLQNPIEVFAVSIIAAVCFALGAWSMWGFVGHRVKTVESQMHALWQDMSNKDRADAQRAAEARVAREAAEAAERQRQINEANTKKLSPLKPLVVDNPPAAAAGAAAAAPHAAAAGVRNGKAKVRRRQCEPGLFGCL